MLAQAKGLNLDDRVKVNSLSGGLNDRLTHRLFSVILSDDDYTSYVKQARVLAGKLEARRISTPRIGLEKLEVGLLQGQEPSCKTLTQTTKPRRQFYVKWQRLNSIQIVIL